MKKVILWAVGGCLVALMVPMVAIVALEQNMVDTLGDTSARNDPVAQSQLIAVQLKDMETRTGLRFPKDSEVKFAHSESSGPDAMMQLKLGMTKAGLAALLAQPPLKKVKWQPIEPGKGFEVDHPGSPEWSPSKVKIGRRAQVDLPNAKYLNILLDDASEGRKDVYLQWFET